MDEIRVTCRLAKSDLCYFRYTLESHEGLCVPTTLPGGEGRVVLATSKGLRQQLEQLLSGLAEEFPLVIETWDDAGTCNPTLSDPVEEATPA